MARLSGRAPNCGSYPSPKPTKKAAPTPPTISAASEDFTQFVVRSATACENPRRNVDQTALGRRGVDLDRPGLRFLPLGQGQGQHAVLVLGVGLLRVDRAGQREAAHERAIRPLDTMVIVLLRLVLELALALEVQGAVIDADLDVLRVHARQFRLQHYVVLGFVDVYRRSPGSGAQIALVKEPRKGVVKQPV